MKKTRLILALLAIISLNVEASCPDSLPNLSYMLKTPLGKGEIIAVVKGRFHPEFDSETGFYVDYFDVKKSYGLVIKNGRYRVAENSNWGNNCIFYKESTKFHDTEDTEGIIYLALSRVHGRTLVTPEAIGHALLLENGKISYRNADETLQLIDQIIFERNLLGGIHESLWEK